MSLPAISADGTIYVGSDDGKLYAIGEVPPRPSPIVGGTVVEEDILEVMMPWLGLVGLIVLTTLNESPECVAIVRRLGIVINTQPSSVFLRLAIGSRINMLTASCSRLITCATKCFPILEHRLLELVSYPLPILLIAPHFFEYIRPNPAFSA